MNTKKIVVGVNGSAAANAALEWAVREAAPLGAEIIAVHVVRPIGGRAPAASVSDVRLREFDYLGSEAQARVKKDVFGPLTTSAVAHRILIVEGHPATEILKVADAENAALIVVGNGLHSTMEDLFLGSVAHELTHRARRPLTVVPATTHTSDVDTIGKAHGGTNVPRQTQAHRSGEHADEVGALEIHTVR